MAEGPTTPVSEPQERHANRLAGETSPYLLQHAHNPVDWWPWGPDALTRATLLDRPIFLSIGYAACHWCHVMERESFEDATTAAFLNGHFIPIKVDREERPDLDQVYMSAVQAMTGGGGWPMSVFLTPAGRPFYGGTYFPDVPRHGLPAFRQVLEAIARAWRDERGELEATAARLVGAITEQQRLTVGRPEASGPALLDAATSRIVGTFDRATGGWGAAPKFPQPMTLELLLRRAIGAGDGASGQAPMAVVRRALDAMADGGIHDQLGGGFHRYATDAEWLVPHFEQMLYDNAQLARIYLHAWSTTGHEPYREVATGTLGFMLRELRREDGTFAASVDADTDGVEGGTFTWHAGEIRKALGEDAGLFEAAYGVTSAGNWEGVSILARARSDAELAKAHGLRAADVRKRLAAARARLLDVRNRRPQPRRDDKALAAWNGLAIGALADAARLLRGTDDAMADRCRDAATESAAAILAGLRDVRGRLQRSWKDGRAAGPGVLEDYADLAEGLLTLYEATFDPRWFGEARTLIDVVLARFADPAGGFFDTADDHERLVARPKDIQDNATPSGGAMATVVLLRLAAFTGDGSLRTAAERAIAAIEALVPRYPTAFAMWLQAIDYAHAPVAEVAIVGDLGDPATSALVEVATRPYAPHRVVAATDPEVAESRAPAVVPLLAERPLRDGRPAAYVCHGFACRAPVTDAEALRAELASVAASSP